jgi:RNase adaptor protein for sRNA GlmZ degradation
LPSLTLKKTYTLIKKDDSIIALPINPESVLDKLFLPNPLIKKPINGKTGISQTICTMLFIRPKSLREILTNSLKK